MELLIIRHSRSEHNLKLTTDLDSRITTFGEHQAVNVGKFLQDKFFSEKYNIEEWGVFTSPFLRCLQTTKLIADQIKDCPKPCVRRTLREYLNHSNQSCEIKKRSEFDFDWDFESASFDIEQNETFLDRMHKALIALPKCAIVVTHGLPAHVLKNLAVDPSGNHVPLWDNSIDNASITWIKNGRLIWNGRNLYHELEYDPQYYQRCFILEP